MIRAETVGNVEGDMDGFIYVQAGAGIFIACIGIVVVILVIKWL